MDTFFLAFGATLIVGTAAAALLAILYPRLRPSMSKQQPAHRAKVLLGWAMAPAGIGLFFTCLLFIPTVLESLGIPAGHCHNHAERLPHICLTNPPLSGDETLSWFLKLILLTLLVGFAVSQATQGQKHARFRRMLQGAKPEGKKAYHLIPWNKPAAFTTGFWAPQIFISRALRQSVSPEQLQIILAHEQGHVRRRDCLRNYLAQTLSLLYIPQTRRQILADFLLATEQACDEEAAAAAGDHLLVAETILVVERLLRLPQTALAGNAFGFVKNHSQQRIQSLLAEGEFEKPLLPFWILFVPLLAKTALLMPGATHSLVEYLVRN